MLDRGATRRFLKTHRDYYLPSRPEAFPIAVSLASTTLLTKTFAMREELIPAEPATMRVIGQINMERGLLASVLGFQTMLFSFFTSILRLHRR